MKNILLTSIGRRVSLVRAFQQELRGVYPQAQVLAVDLEPSRSPACVVADRTYSVPPVTDPSYIDRLFALCSENDVGMIVPTIDTELLAMAENKEQFLANGIHVVVPDVEFVQICRDKRLTHEFFERQDIAVPRYIDKSNPTFPLFVKPYDGSCSKDTQLVTSEEMLSKALVENEKLLFLEAIDRDYYDEFTIDLYYNRSHELCCVVPRKRLEVRAGEVSKGLTVRNEIVPFLRDRLPTIPGAIGCLTAQLFMHREKNHFYGIEINPRFGGGYPLSYRAGANYPKWLIEEYYKQGSISYFDGWEHDLLMLRYDDEVFVNGFSDND